MAITPTGSPPWTRTSDHTQYGGNVNKRNYGNVGVVDAQTDVGAEDFCRLASDVAALARTADFAVITYLCNDSVPAAPTIEVVYMMTGTRVTSYAGDNPPSGFPSAARNGNGDVTFTFASSYADDYGVSGSFAPVHCMTTVQSNSSVQAFDAHWEISGQTVRVRVVNDSGAAVSNPRVTLVVK
jgi:hypothetical protein